MTVALMRSKNSDATFRIYVKLSGTQSNANDQASFRLTEIVCTQTKSIESN